MIQASRIQARAVKASALNMRAISRSPDVVPVTVVGQRSDGLYLVRRDHWPTTIAVPVQPPTAVVPWPCRANLICEGGTIQRGELYWPWPEPSRKHGLTFPQTLDWFAHSCNPLRTNAMASIAWREDTASQSSALTGTVHLLRQWQGSLAWTDLDQGIWLNGTQIVDGGTDLTNFFYWSNGLTYQDGVIYALHSDCGVAAIAADGTVLWERVIFSDWGLPGGLFDGGWLTNSDPVLIGDRLVILGERYDLARPAKVLITLDAATGDNLYYWYWEQYAGYDDHQWCWQDYNTGPEMWVYGNLVYFAGYSGEIVCLRVNPDDKTISVEWESEFPANGEERRRRILGIVDGALICAYEYHEFEQVVDNRLEEQWDPVPDVSERWTYKDPSVAPIGIRAGVESLSLLDGSLLGETEEPGSTEWQTRYGPTTDYLSYGSAHTFTGPPSEAGDGTGYQWLGRPSDRFGFPGSSRGDLHFQVGHHAVDPEYASYPEWEDGGYYESGYDPSTDPDWAALKAVHSDPDGAYFSPHFVAEYEGLVSDRTDPDDFLVQVCTQMAASWRFFLAPDSYTVHALTWQWPYPAVAPAPGATVHNSWFVETAGTNTIDGAPLGILHSPGHTITKRYHWRHQTPREILRTPTLPIHVGRSCQIGSLVVVAGIYDGELQWRAYNATAVEQWRYTITEVGGETLDIKGAPFASSGRIHTHITRSGNPRLITLDTSGNKLSEVICPPNLKNPTFDGVDSWISQDGQHRFGP